MSKEQIRTRRQVAYSKQEQEQLKLIYTGLSVVAGLVALILIFGLVQTYYIEPNSAVTTVNGSTITLAEYQSRVRYERFLLEQQYNSITQQMASLKDQGNEQFVQFYQQYANQILQQRAGVDQQTIELMIQEKLLASEAVTRNITVSDDDVTQYINRLMASQKGGVTEASAQETVAAAVQATSTAASWTPTPTFTPEPTLASTKGITPTATPFDTPTPGPTPTINVVSPADISTQYTTWLQTIKQNVNIDEATYRGIIRLSVLSDKVRDAISAETPKKAEQSNARHILVTWQDEATPTSDEKTTPTPTPVLSEEEKTKAEAVKKAEAKKKAEDIIKRLKKGEDFAKLAEEFSADTGSKSTGGDLGFVTKGRFVESVDKAVFELPIGKVGDEPVESQFGWHIIEVIERGERELAPSDYEQAKRDYLTKWLDEIKAKATIQDNWTPSKAPQDNFLAR